MHENQTTAAGKTMKAKSLIKKPNQGPYDYGSDGKVFFCKWNESSIVNINFLRKLCSLLREE